MMIEAQTIAKKLGVKFSIDVDRRLDDGAAVGSVKELGRLTDTPTPTLDTVLALVQMRARTAGLYS